MTANSCKVRKLPLLCVMRERCDGENRKIILDKMEREGQETKEHERGRDQMSEARGTEDEWRKEQRGGIKKALSSNLNDETGYHSLSK